MSAAASCPDASGVRERIKKSKEGEGRSKDERKGAAVVPVRTPATSRGIFSNAMPTGILLQIVGCLRPDSQGLKSLSVTSRWLRELCIPTLFERVRVRYEGVSARIPEEIPYIQYSW